MSAAAGIGSLEHAQLEADVELVPLAHGLRAVLVVGWEAKAEALRRIARREAEREREAKDGARRAKTDKLARSNERRRGTRPGGAA